MLTNQREPNGLSHEAFTVLVANHQQQLLSFLRGLLRHVDLAFDLMQETFYQAWQATQKGDPPFTTESREEARAHWLFRAAYHNALSVLRRNRLIIWESLDGRPELSNDFPIVPFEEQVVENDALLAALAQLSPQDVACLLLRLVQGFSAAEVGVIVGTTADTINKRLSRAKQRLRAIYYQQNNQIEEHTRR